MSHSLKLIALGSLFEYIFLKPYLLPNASDSSDFIGFGLSTVIFAYVTQIYLQDLDAAQMREALKAGGVGGGLAFAWLLFYVGRERSQIQHLLVANVGILGAMLLSAWKQRREAREMGRRGGGGRLPPGGGTGSRIKTAKDMDRVNFVDPRRTGGCCVPKGLPVD